MVNAILLARLEHSQILTIIVRVAFRIAQPAQMGIPVIIAMLNSCLLEGSALVVQATVIAAQMKILVPLAPLDTH